MYWLPWNTLYALKLKKDYTCSLPLRRVHGIKRMYLASRTHGLHIYNLNTFRLLTTFNHYTTTDNYYVHAHRLTTYPWCNHPWRNPLVLLPLADSLLLSIPFPFTYLETLHGVIGSCPPWSQVADKLSPQYPGKWGGGMCSGWRGQIPAPLGYTGYISTTQYIEPNCTF